MIFLNDLEKISSSMKNGQLWSCASDTNEGNDYIYFTNMSLCIYANVYRLFRENFCVKRNLFLFFSAILSREWNVWETDHKLVLIFLCGKKVRFYYKYSHCDILAKRKNFIKSSKIQPKLIKTRNKLSHWMFSAVGILKSLKLSM